MKVISRKVIDEFIKKHPEARSSIESWYAEAKDAAWQTSMDIKGRYNSASFLPQNYVIFNIKGNGFRLVTKVAYRNQTVLIKWIGSHAAYDQKTFP